MRHAALASATPTPLPTPAMRIALQVTAARHLRSGAVLAIAALLGACATTAPPACGSGQQARRTELVYFGTQRPGGVVSEAEWKSFLDQSVTPRFPDGLSVWKGQGQWKSNVTNSIVAEDSYVLSLVHGGEPAAEAGIRSFVDAYKQRFSQEAVMRVSGTACVSF